MTSPIKRLLSFPQRQNEVWQGGIVRLPNWITGEGEPYRPYAPMWVSVTGDKVHGGDLLRPDEIDFAAAVDTLVEFASEAGIGGYRPGRIEVSDPALAEHLSGMLSEAEIEVRLVKELRALDGVLDEMESQIAGTRKPMPGPLDAEGVTLERMRRYAEAAQAFFRAAPWQFLTDLDLVRIEEPKPPQGMEWTVALGAGHNTYGLGFYRSLDDYAQFRRTFSEAEPELRTLPTLWQFSYGGITEIPLTDAGLWEDHRLPVASEQAYPLAIKIKPGGTIVRPGATELLFLEGLLRALSQTTEDEIDSGRWQKEVDTSDGPMRLTLAIPDLLSPPTAQEWMKRGLAPDRRASERLSASVERYFRDHPPDSTDEMNDILQSRFSGRPIAELAVAPETPEEHAQELCYQAFDTYGRRRVQLARKALEIYPNCAEAYVILAEQSGTLEAERDFYAQGVQAAERALGPETFENDVGHFWGITGTRPYMRARFGLAQALEQLGNLDEAVEHHQELLRLNPGDNQGVRYLLLPRLLELGRDVDAARLLKQFDEATANWAYAQALLAYRLSGSSKAAQREFRSAFRINPYVPEYLTDMARHRTPEHYSIGSREEAILCVQELAPVLEKTEGSLDWVLSEHKRYEKEARMRQREKLRKDRQRRKKKRGR